jgi:hypothetical protein
MRRGWIQTSQKIDAQLIDFLIEEAGENIDEYIALLSSTM